MKEVEISILGVQVEGEERNEISSVVKGRLYKKRDTYYLKYKEKVQGLEGVKTTLKIEDEQITLIRQGQVRSIQKFVSDEKTEFDYKTPYGMLKLVIEVEELKIDVGNVKGQVNIHYILHDQQQVISTNQLDITYK